MLMYLLFWCPSLHVTLRALYLCTCKYDESIRFVKYKGVNVFVNFLNFGDFLIIIIMYNISSVNKCRIMN